MSRLDLVERRDVIVALLSEGGPLSATELSDRLGVSVQTVRADLRDLDQAGLVQRRNGRVQLRNRTENIGYHPRVGIAWQDKQRIATVVRGLIPDGSRLALGTGTTVEHCARFLAGHRDLFVATNSIHAVSALQNAPGIAVAMAGGTVRMRDLDLVGATALEFFAGYRMDFAIFSCGGLTPLGEVLDYDTDEVMARRAIAGCAATRILVADGGKMGLDLACRHGRLSDHDIVVTTAPLPDRVMRECAGRGTRVLVA
ncbi:DeoR/GlpR family DNA-binding transcription regulator [Paracoccus sp. PARArs4]|uniref:DeoR/GlpR family DNA-binding transcription regulator n=1 Tax=Paracoccus sp. PARArs4 TaxID=2853442 RepID=UPI0024A611F2|nr:DeoR/GlpR family DNA-binding transcription regulator [Paracoccus sp. PARArs4]